MVIKMEPRDVLISQAEEEGVGSLDILCDVVSIASQAKDPREVVPGGLADKVRRVDLPAHHKPDDVSDEGAEGEQHHERVIYDAELAGPRDEVFGLLGVLRGPAANDAGQDNVPGDVDGAADVGDQLVAEWEGPGVLEVVDKVEDLFEHVYFLIFIKG